MYRLRITSDLGFEVWADIPGYEGLYQVSTYGRVRSLDHYTLNNSRIIHKRIHKGKILKPLFYEQKYLRVDINKKHHSIHRLVANTFIPNHCNYPEINHKDENPSNNRVENLEWCTRVYNNNYGTRKKRVSDALKGREVSVETREKLRISHIGNKPGNMCRIKQYNKHYVLLNEYESIHSAALSIGVSDSSVRKALLGSGRTCRGYIFERC